MKRDDEGNDNKNKNTACSLAAEMIPSVYLRILLLGCAAHRGTWLVSSLTRIETILSELRYKNSLTSVQQEQTSKMGPIGGYTIEARRIKKKQRKVRGD